MHYELVFVRDVGHGSKQFSLVSIQLLITLPSLGPAVLCHLRSMYHIMQFIHGREVLQCLQLGKLFQ